MGLKLNLIYLWTPGFIIRRELANVSEQTTRAVEALVGASSQSNTRPTVTINEQRANMAKIHARLVDQLKANVGEAQAIRIGREALFSVGENLGRQVRHKLSVGDNPKDLVKAAKILYRILGIDFTIEWVDESNAVAVINHCALSEHYSELTCKIFSATDEGVMKGLQPNAKMQFKEYLTSGCKNCKAEIHFNRAEA